MSHKILSFKAGGSLTEAHFYIERDADKSLPASLMCGELCYVLAPRQMGKSSLRYRAAQILRTQHGVYCASVDLTKLGGSTTNATDWYYGLLHEIAQELGGDILSNAAKDFWLDQDRLPIVQRFARFIRDILLSHIRQQIVIFIDEIEMVRNLPFSGDDFIAAVRALYNARADDAEYNRITFCLLGVVQPGDLIVNERITNFNIGRRIELEDFTRDQLAPLRKGLQPAGGNPDALLDTIFGWTHGHPYMVQSVCNALLSSHDSTSPIAPGNEAACVNEVVESIFLQRTSHRDPNLDYAEKNFRRSDNDPRVTKILAMYAQLVRGEYLVADGRDSAQTALLLTGLAAVRSDQHGRRLEIRNKVFATVFDEAWVRAQQVERSLTDPLLRWLESRRSDDYVLRGDALRSADQWATGRFDITSDELQFLQACWRVRGAEDHARIEAAHALAALEKAERERALGAAHERDRKRTNRLLSLMVGILFAAVGATYVFYARERGTSSKLGMALRETKEALSQKEAALLRARNAEQQATDALGKAQTAEKNAKDSLNEVARARDEASRAREKAENALAEVAKASNEASQARKKAEDALANEKKQRAIAELALKREKAARDESFIKGRKLVKLGQSNTAYQAMMLASGLQPIDALRKALIAVEPYKLTLKTSPQLEPEAAVAMNALIKSLQALIMLQPVLRQNAPVTSAIFAPNGHDVLSTSYDGSVRIWDSRTGEIVSDLRGHKRTVDAACYSPNGYRVLSASRDNTAVIWNAQFGKPIVELNGHTKWVRSVSFSPDGMMVSTASEDGTARLWDAATGTQHAVLGGHTMPVFVANFSPNADRVVTASSDGTARIWDSKYGLTRFILRGHTKPVRTAVFSPDGKSILTASDDGSVRLWNAHSGKLTSILYEHTNQVYAASFSRDGKLVISASADGSAKIWNAKNGNVTSLRGHIGAVRIANFSRDGSRAVSAGDDGTARLWDTLSGSTLGVFAHHQRSVYAANFSSDGSKILTAGQDGLIYIYDTRISWYINQACELLQNSPDKFKNIEKICQ